MSVKYRIINNQEFNDWTPKCPLKVIKTQIVESSEKERFIQFKFKNLTKRTIKSIYIDIECYDDTNKFLGVKQDVDFLDIDLPALDYYQDEDGVKLNKATYLVNIIIKKITFKNMQSWENKNVKATPIKEGAKLNYSVRELALIDSKWTSDMPYKFIPKEAKNYWQCACGEYNDKDKTYCGLCGSNKEHVFNIFDKKELDEELKKKDEIEELEEEKRKLENDYINRKYNKQIKKSGILIGIACIFVILGIIIFNIMSQKDLSNYVKKFCDNDEYQKSYSLTDVMHNYSCGTFALYLRNKDLTEDMALGLIDSENVEIYRDFKKIKNKELLEYVFLKEDKEETNVINTKYLEYLHKETDFKPDSKFFDDTLTYLFYREKYDDWKKVVSYLKKYEYSWSDGDRFFTSGYGYSDALSGDEKTKKAIGQLEYSKYYHEASGDYKRCYTSDLYDKDLVKTLISKIDKEGEYEPCMYALTTNISYVSLDAIKNYVASGADLNSETYLGTILHRLVYSNGPTTAEDFEAKVKLLVKNGANINKEMGNDSSNPGYTPLDLFANQGYTRTIDFQKYRILKNYGAKCNKRCSDEKKYKEGSIYEY